MSEPAVQKPERAEMLGKRFDDAIVRLGEAADLAKSRYQNEVHQLADTLSRSREGLEQLFERAHLFEEAGVFAGGPWADPTKLNPRLIEGCLLGEGIYPIMETLSELRMLALATGRATREDLPEEQAVEFLERALALNVELVLPEESGERSTEARRDLATPRRRETAEKLFGFLVAKLPPRAMLDLVLEEIEAICEQRPIITRPVRRLIRLADRIEATDPASAARVRRYRRAVATPGDLSETAPSPGDYRTALRDADGDALTNEAVQFAESLRKTGLASSHHSVLLRHLRRHAPELLAEALGLNAVGAAELEANLDFVRELITVAVVPGTAQAVYGLARCLERGLLSRPEVSGGLRRLIELDLLPEVKRALLATREKPDGVTANALLVAGAICVLGQPLGVGQGRTPTCQAARGISLWSQHWPGYLLELVSSAARDGLVQMDFEGTRLDSSQIAEGVSTHVDPELDPVSLVLVPHIDKLYNSMMVTVALRNEDGHKWVNPQLYGRLVPSGFASVFEKLSGNVVCYQDFVRRFYATHHPAYNDGHELIFSNPVGIMVTTAHADLLGPHAVTLLRVDTDADEVLRAYFFNPNDEGRQNWGQGVEPSTSGHGEEEGESSLPFPHFVSRLYAFHYNPYEEGDAYAVPDSVVAEVEELVRTSWGRAYTWA